MSSQPVDHRHPVLDFAHRLTFKLDALATTPVWSMNAADQRDALLALTRGQAQLDALRLRLLAEADRSEATTETGAGTAADWIAVETRQVRRDARSDLNLANALDQHHVLATAMAEGRVNTAQARAIVAGLERLPSTGAFAVSTEQRQEAESYLVEQAEHHDAKALRILGLRIFEVIAPDLAEQFEGRALEAEEALALRRTTFTMRKDEEGTCHGRFRIPALHGQMLGCTAHGCETPPGMCHAHHDTPWSEGGLTNVETGRLLCPHHHRRIHDPKYQARRMPSGKIAFHRRT